MELARTKEIVQALADGVDPYTGDRFPADGPYQRADTVRALHTIIEEAESGKKPKNQNPVDPEDCPFRSHRQATIRPHSVLDCDRNCCIKRITVITEPQKGVE